MRNQVLTIEQMKHLKELGVDTRNASVIWINYSSIGQTELELQINTNSVHPIASINTFTLQDILELLPKKIVSIGGSDFFIEITFFDGNWCIEYIENAYDPAIYVKKSSKSILDTAYERLCWCAENSYLTIK